MFFFWKDDIQSFCCITVSKLVLRSPQYVRLRIQNLQCPDCKKSYTKHLWESSVQAEGAELAAGLLGSFVGAKIKESCIVPIAGLCKMF